MATVAEQILSRLRETGLDSVLYTPGQDSYQERNTSYWSLTPQLKPCAILQPRNTEEVSKAVTSLAGVPECKFAIRSGGHMSWAGANNINNGITIDLGLMVGTTYNPKTRIASLLPGGTWTATYKELEKYGRMVAGGREGQVGISGLLLGGGNTFYTCRVGFACDQVVNYEVVLADGSIVSANEQTNSDLFRALKGGGNNFGIVTRFDVATFPAKDIWDGNLICGSNSYPEVAKALVGFVDNLPAQADSHVLAMWTYLPQTEDYFINLFLTSLDGEVEPRSLRKFLGIPGQKKMETTTVATRMESFILPSGKQDIWMSLTFKADLQIILKAAEVFEVLVKTMKTQIPDQKVYHSMVLQPLPTLFTRHSTASGGNMLGLDSVKDDCILLVWAVEVETPEISTKIGFPELKRAIGDIETYAQSLDADVDFRYLNLCDGSQDPLGSYGAKNVRMMLETATKYDPTGVFQTQVPGGFKISQARTR